MHGSITALATPFASSGALDIAAWRTLVAWQVEAGTQGLIVAGSTGEAAMLSDAEFSELIQSATGVVGGRVPVLAGAGLSGTEKALSQCLRALDAGADGVLVVTPPYVRPTQDGLRHHYETLADALDAPLILYNVPSRTGVDLLPETVAMLAPHPRIVGIKEAVSDPARMAALLPLRTPGFAILSGDDGSACEALSSGADGVVSVVSNAIPAAFRHLCDLARTGDAEAARALDAELSPLYATMGLEPNPIPVKAVLAALGRCHDRLRLPLLPLSSRFRPEVEAALGLFRAVEARFGPGRAS
ncbi:4-hydroxy-tetrahydrodipicolinate synthase [Xanthomonadaceae bacterium JHOS43]|nr:4-hydroxy-tetrahydrodipicolinate synthase [Xanthomonadaceae bacterium JHOS43]